MCRRSRIFFTGLLFLSLRAAVGGSIYSGENLSIAPFEFSDRVTYDGLFKDTTASDGSKLSQDVIASLFERQLDGNQILGVHQLDIRKARKARAFLSDLGLKIIKGGKIVGFITLHQRAPGSYWETATILARDARGMGIGTEARRAVTDFMLRRSGEPGLISNVFRDNIPSLVVTKKLGMRMTDALPAASAAGSPILEFRLARETFAGAADPNSAQQLLPETVREIRSIASNPTHPRSKVGRIYAALMADGFLRARLYPEELGKLSEDLANAPSGARSLEAISLKLRLRRLQDALSEKLKTSFGREVISLSLKEILVSGPAPLVTRYQLVATLEDGAKRALTDPKKIGFFVDEDLGRSESLARAVDKEIGARRTAASDQGSSICSEFRALGAPKE